MPNLDVLFDNLRAERLPAKIGDRTRRIYDLVAGVYPVSGFLFHSKVHSRAVELSSISNGSKILEVAVGSGEMFSKLARKNSAGLNVGLDLSPQMAAATLSRINQEHPSLKCTISSADSRMMPFESGTFDRVVCSFLFELLSISDIMRTLYEIRRILKPGGGFTLIMIDQHSKRFNSIYRFASSIVPSFLGRQVDDIALPMLHSASFTVEHTERVVQAFYPSRIVISRRD